MTSPDPDLAAVDEALRAQGFLAEDGDFDPEAELDRWAAGWQQQASADRLECGIVDVEWQETGRG